MLVSLVFFNVQFIVTCSCITKSFSSNISLSSIFKLYQITHFSHLAWLSKPACLFLGCNSIFWSFWLSFAPFPIWSQHLDYAKDTYSQNYLQWGQPNLISHESEKHGLSNTSVGKIQFLCNLNSIGFQNDSISKLFHHLQHILTDKIPKSEDRNYLNLQRTKNTGTIRASTLHISSRDLLKVWMRVSVAQQSYISHFVIDSSAPP